MRSDNQFKTKDKKTQKMSKDGLVETNQSTGEKQNISQRGQEINLSQKESNVPSSQEQAPQMKKHDKNRKTQSYKNRQTAEKKLSDCSSSNTVISQDLSKGSTNKRRPQDTEYTRKFIESDDKKSSKDSEKVSGNKFQFSEEEKAPEALSKKLTKTRRKAAKADDKLVEAKQKLPTRQRIQSERVYSEKKGKPVRKFHIEKEVKSQRSHIKGPLPFRPIKRGGNAMIGYGHKKMYEVQHENVGTEAAHKGEIAAEGAARSAYRFHKTKPYRKVTKRQETAAKAHIKLDYQEALHKNPELKSNAISRFQQKHKIKRQYAKAAKEAKKNASRTQKAGSKIGKIYHAVKEYAKNHPIGMIVLSLIFFLILCMTNIFSSLTNVISSGMTATFMSSYLADDEEINKAELAYSRWETNLLLEARSASTTYPGYDEYKYNIGNVGHNPFELISYLTAKYQDFTFAAVEPELRLIFNEQYSLTFDSETEIRTRPVVGSENSDEGEQEEEYEWNILNVNLTSRSFSSVVSGRMTAMERDRYGIYMQTNGNRQYTLSPFAFDWLDYVSCHFGYRVHPITGQDDYHNAVDIAVAAGTEILATHDGTVTTATFHNSYGNYILLDSNNGLVTRYAHCSQLLVSAGQQVKQGDVIAKVGSTGDSTGPHLHFEVIYNGEHMNPLFFSEGANGSGAAPGTPGGGNFPNYPGEPMGDGSYAALMAEAQKHIGKPYVFGASGPDVFDCSGFVCWSLNKSGVANVGRTTAQGLYNLCTPVSRDNAKPGDLIFFSGTYSTPNAVSHIGIYVGNGQMLHCGDPIGYAAIDSAYWQSHFYAFGRV